MDAITAAVRKLIEAGAWTGTATLLLARLAEIAGEAVTRRADWPKNARVLAARLRRGAPQLLAAGVVVLFERSLDTSRQRLIRVQAIAEARPAPPAPPVDLLEELRRRGIDLSFDGRQLRYRGPVEAFTPALRRAIDDQQAALIARLVTPADPIARRIVIQAALRDAFARLDVLHRDGLVASLRRIRAVLAWQVALEGRAGDLDVAARFFVAGGALTDTAFREALGRYEALCRQALEALGRYDRRPTFALNCPRCRGPSITRYRDGPLCDRCRGGLS